MALYYNGNLEEDLKSLKETTNAEDIEMFDILGTKYGYGRCQQILQVLWANKLAECNQPVDSALFR